MMTMKVAIKLRPYFMRFQRRGHLRRFKWRHTGRQFTIEERRPIEDRLIQNYTSDICISLGLRKVMAVFHQILN